jgi:oligopeptide/dipeptide ABC transporter ATP-binding protein
LILSQTLLNIQNLKTYFYTYAGIVKALDGIDFKIAEGETVGLVGETGCGKSVTSLAIMRLVPDPPGRIVDGIVSFKGQDLLKKSEEEMRKIRGSRIAMVFQDPMTFINPVISIGDQIGEVIALHQNLASESLRLDIEDLNSKLNDLGRDSGEAQEIRSKIHKLEQLRGSPPKISRRRSKKVVLKRIIEVLKLVRMPYPEKVVKQYPHELSGGMRQRAMIAMALSCKPDLLIADEATTSLDVTIQAQILNLLNDLKKKLGSSVLMITHDLGIVAEMCDRVIVMYAGVVVEEAETKELFRNPLHPYTVGLLSAIPRLDQDVDKLEIIPGSVPNLIYPPPGCRFHPRCKFGMIMCKDERPSMIEVAQGHKVACYVYGMK